MYNNLDALNNALFEQIERLQDDTLTGDSLENEVKRTTAITNVSKVIVDNARLALDAKKHFDEYGVKADISIPLLGVKR